jgi:hypothetical protein
VKEKGNHVFAGDTVLTDRCGEKINLRDSVDKARTHTDQVRRFLQSPDSRAVSVTAPASYWWALLSAVVGLGAASGVAAFLVAGFRRLGVYRLEVFPPPTRDTEDYRVAAHAEGRLRVQRAIVGIPVRAWDIPLPADLAEVGIERGTTDESLSSKGEPPFKGGRLVLRTRDGVEIPVLPVLRRGEEVHDRARAELASALGVQEGAG